MIHFDLYKDLLPLCGNTFQSNNTDLELKKYLGLINVRIVHNGQLADEEIEKDLKQITDIPELLYKLRKVGIIIRNKRDPQSFHFSCDILEP